MSFKRDGDDGSQLNLLKKRRVAELLAKDIPDDEAMLMSNGRYACTVCHYKPVFDTVDMLTIHRGGKKHQHATENHFAKKRELALLVQKRRIEAELKKESSDRHKGEEPSPLLQKVEAAKRHTLLKEAPYNPCHTHKMEGSSKKSKGKLFFEGIRQINLRNATANQQRTVTYHSSESMRTSQTPAPGFSNFQTHNPIDKAATPRTNIGTKPDFKSTSQTPTGVSSFQIKPYIPKAKRTAISSKAYSRQHPGPDPTDLSTSTQAIHDPLALFMQRPEPGEDDRPSSIEFIREFYKPDSMDPPVAHEMQNRKLMDENMKYASATTNQKPCFNVSMQRDIHTDNRGLEGRKGGLDGQKGRTDEHRTDTPAKKSHDDISRKHPGTSDQQTGLSIYDLSHHISAVKGFQQCTKGVSHQLQDEKGFLQCKAGAKVHEDKTRRKTLKTTEKDKSKMSAEKRKELQRHLELTSAGWVQDNGGQWVRGEDVEFDSDEEAPIP